jgi:hypothetical protein
MVINWVVLEQDLKDYSDNHGPLLVHIHGLFQELVV